jgi:hypothetical protein
MIGIGTGQAGLLVGCLQPRKPDYAALDREAAALVEGKK